MKLTHILLAGTTATLMASAAFSQTAIGASAAEDRIDDLRESIEDDFERDLGAFGNEGRALGYTGSLALQATATSGNTDTGTLGLGTNFGYYDGVNGYTAQFSYQYSESNGVKSEDSMLYDLEYTRDFGTAYYGFAKLQGTIENFPADTTDNFLGFGVGYRIYNTADMQWSVQAGLGYRVAELNRASDLKEGALSLSSDFYTKISDTLSFTNDTDIIGSKSDTVVYNDLGFNVSMTEVLALRTSLVTEYHTDPAPGRDSTDNKLGVSLVYNFN